MLALVAGGGGIAAGVGMRLRASAANRPSFAELPGGNVAARAHVDIENDGDRERRYSLSLAEAPDATLRSEPMLRVAPRKHASVPLVIELPRAGFVAGKRTIYLRIADDAGFHRIARVQLVGPAS